MAELLNLFEEAHAQSGISEQNGSNNWAVDGSLTATGYPLLAGDPHLSITVPSFWHVQHIQGPQFFLHWRFDARCARSNLLRPTTATQLGVLPLRARTPRICSWSRSGTVIHPTTCSRANGCQRKIHMEKIWVKGKDEPVIERVIETHHGPVVTGGQRGPAVALCWSGNEIQQTFSSFISMHSAKTVDELMEAHRQWTSHTNRVLADTSGNIGYLLSASSRFARVAPLTCLCPDGPANTSGRAKSPSRKCLGCSTRPATLSTHPTTSLLLMTFPRYVAPAGNPTRAQRVMQMLTAQTRFAVDDFERMQADNFNIPGARMAKRVRSVPASH